MEKFRKKIYAIKCSRLLVFCLFFVSNFIYSQDIDLNISNWDLNINESLVITISVDEVLPKDVYVEINKIPESFTLISEKKDQKINIPQGSSKLKIISTVFTYEWEVLEEGSFELGEFYINVDGKKLKYPSVYINVKDKQNIQLSFLRWSFEENKYFVGKALELKLYGVFYGSINSLSCEIPEDSLLETIENNIESINAKQDLNNKDKNTEKLLAVYRWTPLKEGFVNLPKANFIVSNKDGIDKSFTTPKAIYVEKNKTIENLDLKDKTQQAFLEIKTTNEYIEENFDKSSLVELLASLRKEEYNSIFRNKIIEKRRVIENELKLQDTPNTPAGALKQPLIAICLSFLMFTTLLGLISKGSKNKNLIRICLVVTLLFSILFVYVYVEDYYQQAVVYSSNLLQIPELSSTQIKMIDDGEVVKVLKKINPWVFIKTKEGLKGWLLLDNISIFTLKM